MDSNIVPKEEFILAEFQAVIPEFNSGLTHSMRYLTDQLGGEKVLDRKELNYRMKDYSRELISSNPFFNSVNNVMEPLFLNEFNISGRVHSESELTSIQEQQISNIQAFMESSEDVDEFEDMVMSYLANIEGMQLTESERIFTFTIGIIAVEAAKFWEVNGDEIVEISGQGRINGWS